MRCLALLLTFMLTISPAFGHGAYHDELLRIGRELEAKPEDSSLYRQRAVLHIGHEDWQAALVDLERLDRLQSGTCDTQGLRGQALNIAKQWAAAVAVLSEHLGAHPEDAEALFQRGRAWRHLGKGKSAVTDYRAAFEKDGARQPEQVSEVAEAIAQNEGANAGAQFLEEWLAKSGAEPSLLQKVIDLHLQGGQVDSALLHLASLQQAMPRPEPVMARRAEILGQAGRASEAHAAWNELRTHLLALPNLERGSAANRQLLRHAEQALGVAAPMPVIAPPAVSSPTLPKP